MPKSASPRKKATSSPDRVKEVIERSLSLDRRRVLQIENQKKSITRLLNMGIDTETDTTTPEARYTKEMETLFQAAASLQIENEDLTAALRALVIAVDALPDGRAAGDRAAGEGLAYALAAARALSAPVSSPETPVR